LSGADCWGWATWRSAWSKYNSNGKYLLDELERRNLISRFDLDGVAKNTKMLEDQISGKNDSWAIRWHASAFLEGMYTLYPNKSLVLNIGNDDSGTHSIGTNLYDVFLAPFKIRIQKIEVSECKLARCEFIQFFEKSKKTKFNRGFLSESLLKLKCWIK
jgi:hypothetical protein